MEQSRPAMDPFSFFREMYAKTEENTNSFTEKVMGSDSWAAAMGNFLEGYLKTYSVMNKSLDGYWKNLKLVTQDDITRLATLILSVENKVDQLDEQIERMANLLENLTVQESAQARVKKRKQEEEKAE